jgi:hypothetical protein
MALIRMDHGPESVGVNLLLNVILPDPGQMGRVPVARRIPELAQQLLHRSPQVPGSAAVRAHGADRSPVRLHSYCDAVAWRAAGNRADTPAPAQVIRAKKP